MAADPLREFFPDGNIVKFVRRWYGNAMAKRVAEMLALDGEFDSGFVRSLRRSLTAEINRVGMDDVE